MGGLATPRQNRPDLNDLRGLPARTVLGAQTCVLSAGLRVGAWPFSMLYGLCTAVRNVAYSARLARSYALPGPAVCVGNISLGGTGKTPFVKYVARELLALGKRPAVISRGYGASVEEGANDEAAMMRQAEPSVIHRCNPDRVLAAEQASQAGADCFILDDGFQHRRAARDLDIVLLDASVPARAMHLFPRGQLREPLGALGRAGVVVLTHSECCSLERLEELRDLVPHHSSAPLVEAAHRPVGDVPNGRVYAFCGIGNPEAFVAMLQANGADVAGATFFPDHHAYSEADVAGVTAAAHALGAEEVVTTEKDLVKLTGHDFGERLQVVRIEMVVTVGESALRERIAEAVGADAQTEEPAGGHSTD